MKLKKGKFSGRIKHPVFGSVTVRSDGTMVSAVHAPRSKTTLDQFARQIRVRNASSIWQELKTISVADFFPDSAKAWNLITSNAASSPCVYGLPASYKLAGYCTIAPVLVSYGDILPVQYDYPTRATDISLGENWLTPNTLFNDFVNWVLTNNPAYAYGDTISLIYVPQLRNEEGMPYIRAERFHVNLSNEPGTITDVAPDFFRLVKAEPVGLDNALTLDNLLTACAFAFVHTGIRGSEVKSSTQHLICRFDPWPELMPILRDEFCEINKISKADLEFLQPSRKTNSYKFGFSAI